jgi:hypothetical protein
LNIHGQTDTLSKVNKDNAVVEGSQATEGMMGKTTVKTNLTQILRKVVKVSDTADVLANYGRGRELQYQMEKAGKEIKRDLEAIFLSDQKQATGDSTTTARKTSGFIDLVAPQGVADSDTGAIINKKATLSEDVLFDLTSNLYIANSKADIIMYHPKHASFFASLMEAAPQGHNRMKMFDGADTKFNHYVSTIVDPLGVEYKLIPNRFMDEKYVFFYNPSDWTQMVLRPPMREKLAKDGSYEKWMIEMEVGLRHRNPYASGLIEIEVKP